MMAKYEVDRFEIPPDPDLVCCICQCVLHKPLESPCQHVFCKVCIETWLTNRKNCPNCRKHLRISKLKPVLPIVRNMINRLIIQCDNYSHGCVEGIKLEYYDTHADQCSFTPLNCLNTGCITSVLRKDMLAHEKKCVFRLVRCEKGCGLPVSVEQKENHNCIEELMKNMLAMEERFKKISEEFTQLQKRMEKLESQSRQRTPSWEGVNELIDSQQSTYVQTPSPPAENVFNDDQDGSNSQSSEGDGWEDADSNDSFSLTASVRRRRQRRGRREGSANSREDDDTSWFGLHSDEGEGEDNADVGDLAESAVDALLASDSNNTSMTAAIVDSDGESEGHDRVGYADDAENRLHSSISYDTVEDNTPSEQTTRPMSRRRNHYRNADSTSHAVEQSNEGCDNALLHISHSPTNPLIPHSPTYPFIPHSPTYPPLYIVNMSASDSENDPMWERTATDHSSDVSVHQSLNTSDTSPPSTPLSYLELLSRIADLDSHSDNTWSPSVETISQSSSERNETSANEGNDIIEDSTGCADRTNESSRIHSRRRTTSRPLDSSDDDDDQDCRRSNSSPPAKKPCYRKSYI